MTTRMSLQHRLRAWVEAPFSKRGLFSFVFLPFLFFVSFIWGVVASKRRKAGYAKKDAQLPFPVVCIGNVVVGGSGKSPFVRALAAELLESGRNVAIFSRGVGPRSSQNFTCVYSDSEAGAERALTDENQEHLLLLAAQKHARRFAIVQCPDRRMALERFSREVSSENWTCLLDDGLQHFGAGRDRNICLWPAGLLRSAPPFCLPLGPYREGWPVSLQSIARSFDENVQTGSIPLPLASDLGITHSAVASTSWFRLVSGELRFCCDTDVSLALQAYSSVLLVTGIVHPERVWASVEALGVKARKVALADHAPLDEATYVEVQNAGALLLTVKDFCRWNDDQRFMKMIKERDVWLATSKLELLDASGTRCRFMSLLGKESALR